MKTLLIATHNPAKLEELKSGLEILKKEGIELLTLKDVGVEEDPEETGATFQDNAELKARYYGDKTGLPTLADDGGLIIPALNNEPGVKSKRWMGRDATDEELIQFALSKLKGFTGEKRTAYLQTCLCYYQKDGALLFETEKVKGHIGEKSSDRPTNGYPYRALFIVDKFNKYYDELTLVEHDEINHRLKALKRLTKRITDLIS